ncbi:PilW family protein [Halovibrio salipaludis]|nr:PilW family protein [Halovibrio salipaludis]
MANRHEKGFSLVELMVALVISSLVMLGVVQIFIANNKSFHMQKANARTQEAGRIAMEMLTREARNAGFFGCTPSEGLVNNLDENDAGYSEDQHDMSLDEAVMTVQPSSSLSMPTNQITNSHNLRLLGVKAARDGSGNAIEMRVEDVPNSANFQVNNADGLEEGDIIALTDCIGGDVVQVTNVQSGGVIVANSGTTHSPGNSYDEGFDGCSGSNCPSRLYSEGARINRLGVTMYYVENPTDAEPALFRWDPETNSGTELVQGVADMRVQYGVGAGSVDWRSPSAVDPNWADVRAVRISILVRSKNENLMNDPMTYCFPGEPWDGQDCTESSNRTTASDGRLYRVYTATASVRNRNLE